MITGLYQIAAVAVLVTGLGCYGPGQPFQNALIAIEEYGADKADIEQTHTDIAVHGHVVDETGKPLRGLNYYTKEDPGFGPAMVLVAIGWREHAHLGGDPEETEHPCKVDTISYNFDTEMSNVQKLTLIILKPGYEPASFDIIVPRTTKGKPPSIGVDETIVMRRLMGKDAER
jgi:hypothetical protein